MTLGPVPIENTQKPIEILILTDIELKVPNLVSNS